jgi:hypothetical protein
MISNCRRRRLGPAGILGFRATVTPLSGSVRLSPWSHRFSIAVESMIVERRHLMLSTASCEQRREHSNDALPPRMPRETAATPRDPARSANAGHTLGSIRGRRKGRLNQVRRQALPLRNLRRRRACARVRGRAGKGGESNGRFCRRVWRDSSLHPEKVDAWLMNVVGGWNVASTAAAVNDIRAGRREEGFDMGDALHGVLNLY